jgi:hypothetical protein
MKKNSAESIHIRVGIFNLTYRFHHIGNSLRTSNCQIADVVAFNMLIGKSLQVQKPGVVAAKDSMAVSWYHSAFVNSFSDKLLDDEGVGTLALMIILKSCVPFQAFLTGQAMKRTS